MAFKSKTKKQTIIKKYGMWDYARHQGILLSYNLKHEYLVY